MRVKLGDIFEIGSGGTPSKSHPEYYGGNIPWVKTGDLKNEYLYEVEDFITEEGLNNSSAKMYEEDTVLIAMYGATIGATSILKMKACTNQACAAFRKNEQVIPEYLYYFLRSQKEKFVKDGVGGAQPNISAGYLKKVEMELPSLDEQKVIVDILDKISDVVCKRSFELQSLDDLIKARFVELFGDSIINPMGWKKCKFGEVIYYQEGPGVRNWQFRDSGIKLINIRNVVNDSLELSNTNNYLDVEEVENKYKHFLLDAGDYVMASSGVTWGKIAEVFQEHLPLCLNTSMIRIRPLDNCIINKKYIFHFIKSDGFRKQIERLITGSAQPNFGPSHLAKVDILVPDIEVQNQFAVFVEQVDKSKVAIQKALNQAQTLFDSLMQDYFG